MSDYLLNRELRATESRWRWVRFWTHLTWCWAAIAVVGLAIFWRSPLVGSPSHTTRLIAIVVAGFVAVLACASFAWLVRCDARRLARMIENRYPDLDARLVTLVDGQGSQTPSLNGFFRRALMDETLLHARRFPWRQAISPSRRRNVLFWHWIAAGCCAVVWGAPWLGIRFRAIAADGDSSTPSALLIARVDPGDVSIERGKHLLVVATFPQPVSTDVLLEWTDAGRDIPTIEAIANSAEPSPIGHQPLRRVAMTKSLDDPVFAARIPAVENDLSYRVRFGETQSAAYRATVFDYPELLRSDARLTFPSYTGLPETVVDDTRSITAVEGTRLEWSARLNKPVATVEWVALDEPTRRSSSAADALAVSEQEGRVAVANSGDDRIRLLVDAVDLTLWRGGITLSKSRRYRLALVDADGRPNQMTVDFVVNVVPNRTPEIKLLAPARDVQVSPVEELSTIGQLSDDFGILRYGIDYQLSGQSLRRVVLGERVAGRERRTAEQVLDMESLAAKPDQLVSYYYWAEDYDSQGAVRQSVGDIQFAEVRRFEEIFRQGEPSAGGESAGNESSQAAERLAELQKQIMSATWALDRRESVTRTPQLAADAATIRDSQADAKEQMSALLAELTDGRSAANARSALERMGAAHQHLESATSNNDSAPLAPALDAEKDAYQHLLALRASEHRVARESRRQSGGSQGGSRSQQQLDELELADTENRYEAQTSAKPPQRQETRRFLRRLNELAERQQDLNQQIKQLPAALQAERNEQKLAERARQLRRLRDQQQEILRDADSLRDQLSQSPNATQRAETREQLDRTRSQIRRSSESLEQGMASQAAAAGERAADELRRLRDEARRESAEQFTETMELMRRDARQLDEKQQRLSRELERDGESERPQLRPTEDRQRIAHDLRAQKQPLSQLVDVMRQTVEQAESSETLLAKQLYDAVRDAQQRQPENSLEAASQLLERGRADQARVAERDAARTISRLRAGVEKAAESVLGEEVESLRRANDELERLARQLEDEIAARGSSASDATAPNEPPAGNPSSNESANTNDSPPGDADDRPASTSSRSAPSPNVRAANDAARDATIGDASSSAGPLTGAGFRDWSERLRDVEELVGDPRLRAEAGRIRDRAGAIRSEFKRHSREPNWGFVREMIGEPLAELRRLVARELMQREGVDELVPIDRDPLLPEFEERIRNYYERLGSGE